MTCRNSLKLAAAALALGVVGRRHRQRRADQGRHGAGTLSALRIAGRVRQMGRLGNRVHRRALRRSQARMHDHLHRLGRHHPGADHQEDRRHHQLDVDHRRAQEDDRLLRQVLQHATPGIIGPKDQKFDATPAGPEGQDHRRAGLDHAFHLRQEAFHRSRRNQGIPDPGRGQPGSGRRTPRRRAGRLRSRSTPT